MRQDVAISFFDERAEKCPTKMELKNSTRLSCLTKDPQQTFLKSYNCEYIKSPKPDRFQRAMVCTFRFFDFTKGCTTAHHYVKQKQLYRPDFVLNHFIHYSTVTSDLAKTRLETTGQYRRKQSKRSALLTNLMKGYSFMPKLQLQMKRLIEKIVVSTRKRAVQLAYLVLMI